MKCDCALYRIHVFLLHGNLSESGLLLHGRSAIHSVHSIESHEVCWAQRAAGCCGWSCLGAAYSERANVATALKPVLLSKHSSQGLEFGMFLHFCCQKMKWSPSAKTVQIPAVLLFKLRESSWFSSALDERHFLCSWRLRASDLALRIPTAEGTRSHASMAHASKAVWSNESWVAGGKKIYAWQHVLYTHIYCIILYIYNSISLWVSSTVCLHVKEVRPVPSERTKKRIQEFPNIQHPWQPCFPNKIPLRVPTVASNESLNQSMSFLNPSQFHPQDLPVANPLVPPSICYASQQPTEDQGRDGHAMHQEAGNSTNNLIGITVENAE